MYSSDNIEPYVTGMVISYLLASDNAAALPCKRHENRSGNEQKFVFLPEASLCKRSLREQLQPC